MNGKFLPFLRGLLPKPRRFRQSLAGVVQPSQGQGRAEWVLTRPLYRFGRFPLESVPRAQRGRALALQIAQWTPYPGTGQYVAWRGDDALVWIWDDERVQAAVEECRPGTGRIEVIPETLLHQPHGDGLVLHACMDGFEAQLWRDGALASSRWWPRAPDPIEWLGFQRDAGVVPEMQLREVPGAQNAAWQERPWASRESAQGGGGRGQKRERVAVMAIGLVLAMATSWHAASFAKLYLANHALAEELKSEERRAGPVQLARRQAVEALSRVRALQSLSSEPDQLSLMAKVAEKLAQYGATLKEWEYGAGKLKITVTSAAKTGSSEFLKAYQFPGLFENVQVSTTSDPAVFALTMDVVPRADIVFPAGRAELPKK